MNRRTFIAAAAAGAGCAALPVVGEMPVHALSLDGAMTVSSQPEGSIFGMLFHGRVVWFHELQKGEVWSLGRIVGDETASGQCRYRVLPDGDVQVDWIRAYEPTDDGYEVSFGDVGYGCDGLRSLSKHPLTRGA